MNPRRLLPLLAISALTVITIPAWAKSGDSQKVTIELNSTTMVSNTMLKSGEYTVVIEGDQSKFEQNGKIVAQAPYTWKALSSKAPYTESSVSP